MSGESPCFLMFGRDPRFAVENIPLPQVVPTFSESDIDAYKSNLITSLRLAWSSACQYNQTAQRRMKLHYDKKASNSPINVGDRVLLQRQTLKPCTSRKFQLPWAGVSDWNQYA